VSNMSLLNKIASMIQTGVIQFINLIGLANYDYPLHDYYAFADGAEPTAYQVGKSNMASGGDQKKLFTSKSTLLFSDVVCTVRFNNANNVLITLLANTWYEFYQNIHTLIVVTIATNGTLYAYFEGTKPEECRLSA